MDMRNWLPTTRKELEQRGWEWVDVILFSGDAYVDHPSFGVSVIGRVLEAEGLRVAIVAERVGGQVKETVGIENLISVPYTTGQALAGNLRKHLDAYQIAVFDNRQIESFMLEGQEKVLRVKGGEIFRAPALIVATGAPSFVTTVGSTNSSVTPFS